MSEHAIPMPRLPGVESVCACGWPLPPQRTWLIWERLSEVHITTGMPLSDEEQRALVIALRDPNQRKQIDATHTMETCKTHGYTKFRVKKDKRDRRRRSCMECERERNRGVARAARARKAAEGG